MSFTKKTWNNLPDTTTPVNAIGMNDLENRVENGISTSLETKTRIMDCDDATEVGVYQYILATANRPLIFSYGNIIVTKSLLSGNNYITQLAIGNDGTTATRGKVNESAWSTWRILDNTYSTSEKVIGTWINEEPLYRKVINFGSLPNTTTKSVSTGLTNVVYTNIYGYATDGSYYWSINSPRPSTGNTYGIGCYIHNNSVVVECGTDKSNNSAYIVVEYIKKTD